MMTRSTLAILLVCAAVAAGCGGSSEPSDAVGSPSEGAQPSTDPSQPTESPTGGTCLEGATECADIPGQSPPGPPQGGDGDTIDEAAIINSAEALLGRPEDDALAEEDVRLGRHGTEHLALTEDYVIGRRTIATEDDGTGIYRVVEVTVELSEGPVTITEAGAGPQGTDG